MNDTNPGIFIRLLILEPHELESTKQTLAANPVSPSGSSPGFRSTGKIREQGRLGGTCGNASALVKARFPTPIP